MFPSSLKIISPPSLQNEYMKDNFLIKIETWHKPDTGHLENVISKNYVITWRSVCICLTSLESVGLSKTCTFVTVVRVTVLCGSVSGTRSGCRNLEEGGCSLYWYCREKPSGAKGEYVYLKIHIHPCHPCHLIHVVHSGFLCLSPGLQARGGSLQVQVSEDRTRPSRTRLEGTELLLMSQLVKNTFKATEIHDEQR